MEPHISVANNDDVTRLEKKKSVTYYCKINFVCERVKKLEKQKIDEFRDQKG